MLDNGILNMFHSGFIKPWCKLANCSAVFTRFERTTVIMDTSSMEGIGQCITKVNSSSLMVGHNVCLQVLVLLQILIFIHKTSMVQGLMRRRHNYNRVTHGCGLVKQACGYFSCVGIEH